MGRLNDLAEKYGTDKGYVVGPNNPWFEEGIRGHNYCNLFYEDLIRPFVDKECKILEFGVLHGGSLRMWDAYLQHPRSVVIGMDKDMSLLSTNSFSNSIHIHRGDVTSKDDLKVVCNYYKSVDFIIDDASHDPKEQILSLEAMHDKFTSYYIIEDGIHDEVIDYIRNNVDATLVFHKNALILKRGTKDG